MIVKPISLELNQNQVQNLERIVDAGLKHSGIQLLRESFELLYLVESSAQKQVAEKKPEVTEVEKKEQGAEPEPELKEDKKGK